MNHIGPRILLIYDREMEANRIEEYLNSFRIHNLRGTDHVITGVKHCSGDNVDVIIANLIINNENLVERLLSKKNLLGIPIVFYTADEELYQTFRSSKLLKENNHIDIVLNPTSNDNLFTLINKFYRLKIARKTKNYFLAKKHLGNLEKVYFKEITYVESVISYCKLHTKWGSFKISGNLTRLLEELGSDFIKIHEKYVVNSKQVSEFNNQELKIENLRLPIGSTFYLGVKSKLNNKINTKELRITRKAENKMFFVA